MTTFQQACQESFTKWDKSYEDTSYFGYRSMNSTSSKEAICALLRKKLEIVPVRYRKSIFDQNLDPCVQNAIGYWCSNPDKWLHLWGGAGKGKTTVAFGLFIELVKRLVDVNILNVGELENKIKQAISDGKDAKVAMNAAQPKILILDDLGVERTSEYNQEWLFDIIDYRYSNSLTTIITSNFSLQDLYKKYSQVCPIGAERLLSRIKEVCISYEFTNESYR